LKEPVDPFHCSAVRFVLARRIVNHAVKTEAICPCDHEYLSFKDSKLSKSHGAFVEVPYFLSKYDPDSPRVAGRVVEELHELLSLDDSGPYLMVGPSLGGLHVQLYTLRYPKEVVSMILVDSPPADIVSTADYRSLKPQNAGLYTTMRILTGSGLTRLFGPRMSEETLPEVARALPEIGAQYLTLVQQPSYWQTALDELYAIEISADQVLETFSGEYPYGDPPLIVLSTGDYQGAAGQVVFDAHVRQPRLSTQGERRVIERSRHAMDVDASQAIIQAVRDLRLSIAN
jgi:pimeloyl-ACP methyl ester carboxylesterase